MEEVKKPYNPKESANAGLLIEFTEPDGTLTGKKVKILGADSDRYREALHTIQRRRNKDVERTRKFKLASPEQQEQDRLELVGEVTVAWDGFDKPHSTAAVIAMYQDRPDWLEQADQSIHDRELFFKSAAKRS